MSKQVPLAALDILETRISASSEEP